jgi:hypothetical protein
MSRPIVWMSLGRRRAMLRRAAAMRRPMAWVSGLAVMTIVACTQSYDDFDFSGATTAHGGSGGTTTTSHSGGTHQGGGGTGGTAQGGTGGTPTGGAGGGGDSVSCGQTTCDTSDGTVCCLEQSGPAASCEASGPCNSGFTEVHCDGPEDCPGQFCCGTYQNQNFTVLDCEASCGTAGHIIICTGNGHVCPGGPSHCHVSSHLGDPYETCS